MAWFRRTKNSDQSDVPNLEQYYADRDTRNGASWLVALGTILVIALIGVGVFFGTKWLYNVITDNDNPATPTVQAPGPQTSSTNEQKDATHHEGSDSAADSSSATHPDSSSSSSSSSSGSSSSTTPATPPPTSSSTSGSSTTATTDANGKITNTGPGDVVAIALGATVLGYFVSRIYIRSKLTD